MSTRKIAISEGNGNESGGREKQLYAVALPNPSDRTLFKNLLHEAGALHLNWGEALEYVVQQRHERRLTEFRY